jgi:hypothetical protein
MLTLKMLKNHDPRNATALRSWKKSKETYFPPEGAQPHSYPVLVQRHLVLALSVFYL